MQWERGERQVKERGKGKVGKVGMVKKKEAGKEGKVRE